MKKNRKFTSAWVIKWFIFNKFTFTLFEINDRLIFCFVLHFLNIIFANEAIVDFQIAKQIYNFSLRNKFDVIKYHWKIFMHDFSIFRRDNFEIFTEYFVRYNTMFEHWQKLIQNVDFQNSTSWYALRKIFENETHDEYMSFNMFTILIILMSVFQSILMQIISHNNFRIFAKHYRFQNVLWDTQNAYLKVSLNTNFIYMTNNTNFLNRDFRVFTNFINEQKNIIHANFEMIEKQKKCKISRLHVSEITKVFVK